MRLGVDFNILNQKGTPAFYSDTFANRPTYGFAGRVFISTDTGAIYEDTGSAWTLIADAGAGTTGTLQQVTTNGNTTSQGLVVTAGNVAIGTATAGAPLDIHATGTNAQFNGTGTNNAYLQFQNAGANKWRIGNTYAAGSNNLDIYNNSLASNALSFNLATNAATFNNSVTATSLITSGGTSAQFVKGNGSLDSGTYLPITGGISTDQILKVYSSGGNFYLGSSTISDNGTSVTINGRITSNSDTISVNGTAGSIQMQINNQTATTGKQYYFNSKSTGVLGFGNNSTGDILTFDGTTGTETNTKGLRVTSASGDQQMWIYGTSPAYRLYDSISSPTIAGFVGMATAVNNFIQGTASGDMAIGTSTGGKIFIGTAIGTINPQVTITNTNYIGINRIVPEFTLDVNGDIALNRTNKLQFSGPVSGDRARSYITGDGNNNIFIYGPSSNIISTFKYTGNVLIGTTTDTGAKLQINATGINYANAGIYISTSGGTDGLAIGDNGASSYKSIQSYGGQPLVINSLGNNLLVGTTTDAGYKMQVLGGGTYSMLINQSGGTATYIPLEIIHNVSSGSIRLINFDVNGGNTNVGSITSNGTTTSYNVTSDYRLKQDFKDYNGLSIINDIKTYDFEWKLNKSRMYGVIAHELQEILPYAVTHKKDSEIFQQVDFTKIVPILVKAVQELNEKLVRNNIN